MAVLLRKDNGAVNMMSTIRHMRGGRARFSGAGSAQFEAIPPCACSWPPRANYGNQTTSACAPSGYDSARLGRPRMLFVVKELATLDLHAAARAVPLLSLIAISVYLPGKWSPTPSHSCGRLVFSVTRIRLGARPCRCCSHRCTGGSSSNSMDWSFIGFDRSFGRFT